MRGSSEWGQEKYALTRVTGKYKSEREGESYVVSLEDFWAGYREQVQSLIDRNMSDYSGRLV